MSTKQRNDVQVVTVPRDDVAVIREQSLVTLEANHHYFEEVEAFHAPARKALADIYRDAFTTLDAIGWDATEAAEAGPSPDDEIPVPLTAGHVDQLRARRFELGHANIDRVEHTMGWTVADLEPDRRKAKALDRLFGAWTAMVRKGRSADRP